LSFYPCRLRVLALKVESFLSSFSKEKTCV
jgi:hypothetical protein